MPKQVWKQGHLKIQTITNCLANSHSSERTIWYTDFYVQVGAYPLHDNVNKTTEKQIGSLLSDRPQSEKYVIMLEVICHLLYSLY